MSATIIMIIFSITRKKVTNTYSMHRNEEAERSDISGCAYLNIRGDQICDDEANTEICRCLLYLCLFTFDRGRRISAHRYTFTYIKRQNPESGSDYLF